jgi:histone H3/H4
MGKLPKAPFEKILKESAKNIRASDAAARILAEITEEISREIAADAAELAKHAKRKTILEEDVKLARKRRL